MNGTSSLPHPALRIRRAYGRKVQPRRNPKDDKPTPELQNTLTNPDDQLQSVLFDGTIPPEIRDCIFSYVLTEDLDLTKPYDQNTHYTRPGLTHKRKTDTSLLLTCKRVYLEAHHWPLLMRTNTFFFADARAPPNRLTTKLPHLSKLRPSQLEFVQSFHFFAQQFWLEESLLPLCKRDVMKNMVHMKITLRRSDWWFWEDSNPLAITPYAPFPNTPWTASKTMLHQWEEEKQNPTLNRDFDPKYWGSAFQHLPKLKTLIMEFETEKSCEAQADAIARHARAGWKFPMGERGVLSAVRSEIRSWEWQGPSCMLSNEQKKVDPEGRPGLVVKGVKWMVIAV